MNNRLHIYSFRHPKHGVLTRLATVTESKQVLPWFGFVPLKSTGFPPVAQQIELIGGHAS